MNMMIEKVTQWKIFTINLPLCSREKSNFWQWRPILIVKVKKFEGIFFFEKEYF